MTDQQPNVSPLGRYAGFITRLVAFVIDQVIVIAIISVITITANFLTERLHVNYYTQLFMGLLLILVNLAIVIGYPLTFWVLAGQTPGKALMGVRIVRTGGQRLHMRRAFIRWVGYWLSSILFLGFLLVLVDPRRQALHDKLADTFVLYSWPEETQEKQPSGAVRDRVGQLRRGRERTAEKQQTSST